MYTLCVNTAKPYDIVIGPGARTELFARVRGRAFFVSDTGTKGYIDMFCPGIIVAGSFVMEAGEEHKDHRTLLTLYEAMANCGLNRFDTVIAVGGGAVCDLAGFAAATYMRGTGFIACPTTVLAMADAAVGGKCGVNIGEGKNLVGTVRQPDAVIADTDTLSALSQRQRTSGMAEIIKCGAIADRALFDMALTAGTEELIYRACTVKKRYVELDEGDNSERHILNFGHTVGHAAERASGFSLTHGEAVAIGMALEAALGEKLGVTRPGTAKELTAVLNAAGLPTGYSGCKDTLKGQLLLDKKLNSGRVHTALLTHIGGAVFCDVPPDAFLDII